MKKNVQKAALLLLAPIVILSFTILSSSGVKGTITPAEQAGNVWAITGTDSLKTTPNEGSFTFENLQPGTYKVVIEAKEPYKNFVKENVEVKEGEVTDLGSITLEQ